MCTASWDSFVLTLLFRYPFLSATFFALQHTATLHHTAPHCNTLQHTASHGNILYPRSPQQTTVAAGKRIAHECVRPHDTCRTINCVLPKNRVLLSSPSLFEGVTGGGEGRSVWPCALLGRERERSGMQYFAVCCSVLQCVAVCCSVLQYVAVCCSMLQCVSSVLQWVAVCCTVLQRVAV